MYSSDNGNGYSRNRPVVPLPTPEQGGEIPDMPGNMLPNPGEGGPAEPGPVMPPNPPPRPHPVPPRPNPPPRPQPQPQPQPNPPPRPRPEPCYNCSSGKNGRIRFLNAATGYNPFRVYINNNFIVNGLGYASLTPYERVGNGSQTITIAGMNGYVYLQTPIPIRPDEVSTIAIINTSSGLDLLQISDAPCSRPTNMSCLRTCNLAANSNPLDVILSDGRVVFSDVRFKEVTVYRRARPGVYQFYLAETNLRPMPRFEDIETIGSDTTIFDPPTALVSIYVDIGRNTNSTMYILSGTSTPDSIQTIIVEDR